MTNADDLVSSFDSLTLKQLRDESTNSTRAARHLLVFDFPALWMLQDASKAHLHEPYLMNWREKPDQFKYNLREMPAHLSYLLGREGSSCGDVSQPSSSAVAGVLKGIDDLRQIHGQSTISAIAHTTTGSLQIRLGLTTGSEITPQATQVCDLSAQEWKQLVDLDVPWIKVLADVVYRKSARTYLAAEDNLRAQNDTLYRQDSTRWNGRWASWMFGAPNSPAQLFRAHLRRPYSREVVNSRDFVADSCRVVLPCEHEISLSKEEFEALSDEQCRGATCKECSAPVLQARDQDEVEAFYENAKLQQYDQAHSGWVVLDDEEYDIGRRNYFSFQCQVLIDAVPLALRSLDTPGWIQPNETSFVHCEATTAALKCFQAVFTVPSNTFKERPRNLLNNLHELLFYQVQDALGCDLEATFPGWSRFLRIWLVRAMNSVTCRCCIKGGSEHRGYHHHGKDLLWQDVSEAANHLGEDMEETMMIVDNSTSTFSGTGDQHDPLDTDDGGEQWWMKPYYHSGKIA